MKIIQLVSNRVWGEEARHALFLSSALRAEGMETVAVTRGCEPVDTKFTEAGIPIEKASFRGGLLDFTSPGVICHIASQWPTEERIIIHAHNFRDGQLAVKCAEKLRKRGHDAKTVITEHTVRKASADRVNAEVCRRLDAIVTVSGLVRERLLESTPEIDETKVFRIPDSIPEPPLERKEEPAAPRRIPVLLYAGPLSEEKGLVLLLEALVPVKDLVWKMVKAGSGTPEEEAEFRSISRRLGIDGRIQWVRQVTDLWSQTEKADIGVFPSVCEEPMGHRVLEFMRAGLPVVSTDSGAQRELISNGVNGILTHTDPGAFSKGLRQLLENPALRQKIGREALNTFLRFSYPNFYAQMLEVYRNC